MANKYLDGAGLDHMWDKIKAYLVSNYAAKSHTHTIAQITNLQTTLNGKANSSHTHTASQITDLSSAINNVISGKTIAKAYDKISLTKIGSTSTLPSIGVNEIAFVPYEVTDDVTVAYMNMPAGGTYAYFQITRYIGPGGTGSISFNTLTTKISGGSRVSGNGGKCYFIIIYARLS